MPLNDPQPPGDRCGVCEDPLRPMDLMRQRDAEFPICWSPECAQVRQRRERLTGEAWARHLAMHRKGIGLRRERDRATRKLGRRRARRLLAHRSAVQTQISRDHPGLDAAGVDFIDLPMQRVEEAPPDESRTAAYLRFVEDLVEVARESPGEAVEPEPEPCSRLESLEERFSTLPELRPVSESLCGLCWGRCCRDGGHHAFLDEARIRRVFRDNPGWSAEDVLAAYRDHLPEGSVSGSCVNHTARGCSLPRSLRSDVCNGFYCPPIKAMQERAVERGELPPLVVLQHDGDTYAREAPEHSFDLLAITLVTAERQESMDMPPPTPTGTAREP